MLNWWKAVTWAGNLVYWIAMPIIMLKKHDTKYSFRFLFGILANSLLNIAIKYFTLIPRPAGIGPAFPSFHTQTAFFVSMYLYKDYPRASKILLVLATLVGISRVTLGMHTPIDVIAGAILGSVFALIFSCLKMRQVNWRELARQGVHAAGVISIPAAYYFGAPIISGALIILAAICYDAKDLNIWLNFFKRKNEKNLNQAALFFLSIAIVLLLFPLRTAAAGIIALCIGDAVAAVYGYHFGFSKIPYNKNKTYAGTIAGLAANYIILYFVVGRETALVLCLIAALVESIKLNDNLFVPITVSSMLKVLK